MKSREQWAAFRIVANAAVRADFTGFAKKAGLFSSDMNGSTRKQFS
jgi:hypothetical protein